MTTTNPNDSVAGFRLTPPKSAASKQPGMIPLKDMFELASLDAMGLLEDHERKAFDETFARLNPTIQAQLRNQQSRLADLSGTLPQVEPPAGLRDRVIDSITAEIESAQRSAGRIAPEILPSRGVSAVWRIAAIGCAAAALVFGFTTLQMNRHVEELNRGLNNNAVAEVFLREFGPSFQSALLDSQTQFIQFVAAGPATPGSPAGEPVAVILLDTKTRSAQLFCRELPTPGGVYNLALADAAGKPGDVILSFRSTNGTVNQTIQKLDMARGSTLQILHADGNQSAVLKSSNL